MMNSVRPFISISLVVMALLAFHIEARADDSTWLTGSWQGYGTQFVGQDGEDYDSTCNYKLALLLSTDTLTISSGEFYFDNGDSERAVFPQFVLAIQAPDSQGTSALTLNGAAVGSINSRTHEVHLLVHYVRYSESGNAYPFEFEITTNPWVIPKGTISVSVLDLHANIDYSAGFLPTH